MFKKSVVSFFLVICSVGLFACSSKATSDDPKPQTEDVPESGSGEEGVVNPPVVNPPAPDAGNNVTQPPPPEPTNQAECLATCEVSHPNAAQMNRDLDAQCFFGGSCENACNNIGQGQNFTPSPVASAQCNTEAAGSWPVSTPSLQCSDCVATTPACCNLWVSLYGSAEGQALSQCAHDCWDHFPN